MLTSIGNEGKNTRNTKDGGEFCGVVLIHSSIEAKLHNPGSYIYLKVNRNMQ